MVAGSGVNTLLLNALPGDYLWWGVSFLIIGIATLVVRKNLTESNKSN